MTRLTMTLIAALVAIMTGPAGAQVDWTILGETGAEACASLTETRSSRLSVPNGPTKSSMEISWSQSTLANLQAELGSFGTSVPVFLAVFEPASASSRPSRQQSLGTVDTTTPPPAPGLSILHT